MEKEKQKSGIKSVLYSIFGCALLIGMLYVSYIFIERMGGLFVRGINWVAAITSKMDAVVIVALISATVSILGVVISSIIAKRIEFKKSRLEYLAKKREKPYEAFIAMVYRLIQSSQNLESYSEEEMTKDVMSFSQELTLWGSKKVARKWIKFRREVNDPDVAIKRLVFLESIMNEMRRDMGVKRMKKGGLLSFFIRDIDNINAVNGK